MRKNACHLDTMDSADISDAEEIVNLLKPLKKATTVLSDEKSPTLSLIVPLKAMIEQRMTLDEKDSTTIANMKTIILQNLSSRFTEEQDYLLEGTALDPRFRSLPHLLPEQREEVFHRLKNKSDQLQQVCLHYKLSENQCICICVCVFVTPIACLCNLLCAHLLCVCN